MSGMRHSVSTWGKGRGVARVQRLHDGSRATQSPNNISGRRAHPPKVEKIWEQKVNKKEAKLARMSALACTACAECVRARGHQFDDKVTFPIVADDELNQVGTAAGVMEFFDAIGIGYDVDRAKDGTKIRAGRGKMRGRKYRTPVSVLIVISDKERNAAVFKGANTLPGVQVEEISTLNTAILAPGGDAGRLVVYTKSAIEEIGAWTE
jgi:large subunit ribosomal protein L4e